MRIVYLAYKNMVSKPFNLVLSLMLLMLSVFLVLFASQINQQLSGQLSKNIAPFDMVVGAKGSPLQLVLSSVLHVDQPTGNIKLKDAKILENNPLVKAAIPVAYGDNYKGIRILGTEQEYFQFYKAQLTEGEWFNKAFEVVVGNQVAKRLNLNIGDSFVSSHGLVASDESSHDEHPYIVKGILKPTGSVIDQLLVTNIESIWDAHDQHHHDHHHDHDEDESLEDREVTSVLVKFGNPFGMVKLPRFINENTNMQAALPSLEVQRLMSLFGSGIQTINVIAAVILLVSGLSIFISLLTNIRERKEELALLRIYGFQTYQLLGLALLEGVFLAMLGYLAGWILSRFGIWTLSSYMQDSVGYGLQMNGLQSFEFLLLAVIIGLSIVSSLFASLSIFNLNVVKTLSND